MKQSIRRAMAAGAFFVTGLAFNEAYHVTEAQVASAEKINDFESAKSLHTVELIEGAAILVSVIGALSYGVAALKTERSGE
jgi:hypothetical protein